MPMDALVSALIETVFNKLLTLDDSSPVRLAKLSGKVVKIEVRELKPFWLVFSARRVDVLAFYEGQTDASVSLSLAALKLLKEPSALTQYIRQEKLDISGDIQLVQALSQLWAELDIDWTEQLSRYTGDVLAHRIITGQAQLRRTFCQRFKQDQRQLAECLTHEWRLAPGPLEVASFSDDVDELQQWLKSIELRLARLSQQVMG